MQVLLKENMDNLGRRGEVVTVKDGYARNYLLPRNMAVSITKANVQQIEAEKKRLEKLERERMDNLRAVAEQFEGLDIEIWAAANEQGHLFGSVGEKDIVEKLQEKGFNVTERNVKIDEHFKSVGEYDVTIRLDEEVQPTIRLRVCKEGEEPDWRPPEPEEGEPAEGEQAEPAEAPAEGEQSER